MADMVTVQELENAKIDARTIGESVNENKIVTPRYGAPFKSMPMIAEEMQSVIGTIIGGGVPAGIVLDGNQTQKEINLFGGKKYDMPDGGYPIDAKVLLDDNLTEVTNAVAANTANPNSDMSGWVYKLTGQQSLNAKNILEFGSITELRKFKPRFDGDKVFITGLNSGSTLGSGDWYYDAEDISSLDNGWFIVVTNDGKRLKRVDLNKKINLDWAAIPDQGDIAIKWQEAIDYSDSIRIAKGQMFDSPKIIGSGGRFIMSKGVVQPPYLSTEFEKSLLLEVGFDSSISDTAIKLQSKNNTSSLYETVNGVSWNHALNCLTGKVSLRFTNNDIASTDRPSGIAVGNAVGSVNTYSVNCRVGNFEVEGFKYDLDILGKDSWCWRFENCKFHGRPDLGRYGICTSRTTNTNSGERCTFVNSFIRGVYLKTAGMYLYFDQCSFDYTQGAVFKIAQTATYQDIRAFNCHFEMFDKLVDSEIVSYAEDVQLNITGGHILPDGTNLKASHDRILFNGKVNVTMRDVFLEAPVYSSDNVLAKTMCANGANLKTYNIHTSSDRPRVEENKIISRKNDFIPDALSAVLSNSVKCVNFESRNGTGINNATCTVVASPEKTANCLRVVSNGSGGYAFIISKEKTLVIAGKRYVSRPIIELADGALTGDVKPFIDWYDKDGVFISRSVVAYPITIQNYISGAQVLWGSRVTKLIPIIHQSFVAPAGAATAVQGVSLETLVTGANYYLHSVILYDSIEN